MNIEKINVAGFGKLSSREVTLKNGINIIYAPNESGKTTLASFIRFALYGFSKNERASEKNPVTSKLRFIPWAGQQASGSITVSSAGKGYILQRTAKKTTQLFTVNDSLTGEQLLLHKEPGEELLGVGLETFESTAYFGQSAFSGLEMAELEARLRNIATGADEDVSYEKAASKLKNLLNKISGSRATSRSRMSALAANRELLETKRIRLNGELAGFSGINFEKKQERLEQLEKLIEQKKLSIASAKLKNKEEYEEETRLLKERIEQEKESLALANMDVAELTKEEINSATINYYRCNAELAKFKELPAKPKKSPWGLLLILLALLLSATCFLALFSEQMNYMIAGEAICAALLLSGIRLCVSSSKKYALKYAQYEADNQKYGELNACVGNIRELLAEYGLAGCEISEGLGRLDSLVQKRDELQALVDSLSSQLERRDMNGERQLGELTSLYENELKELENEYNSLRIAIAEDKADTVRQNTAREELEKVLSELEQTDASLAQCRADAEAVSLALNALEGAHSEMARLFAPALNKAASEYMQIFSKNERTLTIDSKGNIKVCENGIIRPLGYYSAGTADAVYISVRLALIDLLYNENKPPLVFDDTFANFDEQRMGQMMSLLSKQQAQVIYFTCRDPRPFLDGVSYNLVEF